MAITNPVTGLTAVARYTQIDVSWDAQPDAPSYWVRAFIGTRQVKWETVCGGTNSFITLHNMDQGTTYRISCWAGPDGPGNNVSVMATTKGTRPASAMPPVTTTVPCPDQPPPPPPPGTDFVLNPSAHGYPDSTNTGAILGPLTTLARGVSTLGAGWSWNGSSLTISASGVTLANYDVPGQIFVNGTGALVRNCRAIASAFNGNGITVGGAGYVLDHCTVAGVNDTTSGLDAGIKGKGGANVPGTIDSCHIYHARSGIQDVGGTVQNCYIHTLRHAAGDHINGLTRNGGTEPLTIRHNTILNAFGQTDAVGLFSDFGVEGNDTVTDNILAGGGYCIYGGAGGPDSSDPVNVHITNNRISNIYFPQGGQFGWLAYEGSAGNGNTVSGNVWDHTGKLI